MEAESDTSHVRFRSHSRSWRVHIQKVNAYGTTTAHELCQFAGWLRESEWTFAHAQDLQCESSANIYPVGLNI